MKRYIIARGMNTAQKEKAIAFNLASLFIRAGVKATTADLWVLAGEALAHHEQDEGKRETNKRIDLVYVIEYVTDTHSVTGAQFDTMRNAITGGNL